MSIEEIEEAFLKTRNILEDLQNFLEKRRDEILEKIGKNPLYVIGSAPIIIKEEIVDISDKRIRELLRNPPEQRLYGWHLTFEQSNAFPTLEGLKIEINNVKYVELFRNGYLETGRYIIGHLISERDEDLSQGHQVLNTIGVVEHCVSFFKLLKAIKEHLGLEENFVVYAGLFNIKDFGLRKYGPKAGAYEEYLQIWDRYHLEVPKLTISDFSNPDKIAKMITDRIWQAFGYEETPLFANDRFDLG